jgi:transketolase
MRNEFAAELTRLAAEDQRLVLLSGDIGNRLYDDFKARFPQRFFNCGVAEANMMGVAAGLALCGLRPVVYTIAPFTTTRCLEQIRVDACYNHAPVVIVGVGAGLAYAANGGTHHSCEDIALLRVLPHMTVVCPGDAWEACAALRASLGRDGPMYIRLGKKGEPHVHRGSPPGFLIGKPIVLRSGTDVCLLSTGNMLPTVIEAADELAREGITAQVVSFHTVKPLDHAFLAEVFAGFPAVLTIEEHSVLGGFGGSVAEWLADQPRSQVRARLRRIGTSDTFLHEAGEQEYARERFGLIPEGIAEEARVLFENSELDRMVP